MITFLEESVRRKVEFNDERARTYRKVVEVLAFQSDDPILFEKSWGKQVVRGKGWVIVPLTEAGEPTNDIYGCDAEVFAQTYESSPSLRPNRYRKKELVRAYQPGDPFEIDTVLPDGHVEVKSSGADSHDAWVVKAPGGELYPIEDEAFRRTYREVTSQAKGYRIKTRDDHWKSDGLPKRILALDGGGLRGILTLGYLERIEDILRKRHGDDEDFRLSHYFDLIAGTSTGAIIAACLAKGMAVREIQDLYKTLGGKVFKSSIYRVPYVIVRYNAEELKGFLEEEFNNDKMEDSSLQTGLLVVTKRLDTSSVWPITNNPKDAFYDDRSNEGFIPNKKYLLREVIRASTAAPIFFKPEKIEIARIGKEVKHGVFVDGGVSPNNNPSLLALQYVTLSGFGLKWLLDPDKLFLVSVGTGNTITGKSESGFPLRHAFYSLLSLMDDCSESVETIMQWLSNSPTAQQIDSAIGDLGVDLLAERPLLQYLRYNVLFKHEWLVNHLGMNIKNEQVETLNDMDEHENMELLAEIGVEAAKKQIKEDHFPSGFDLA